MQLSPRQYQVDPTGAAYVQDTRPLMAAMGAQAATQIEGNRMMTETMQKGMQGIENFAARRQLAAARAQLGTLDPEAENYGQQLSGLILDNPLAFTNPKTAPIANMAFKQASDENQARLDRKYKLEDMATQFGYAKQLAAMRMKQQSAAYRLTPEQKFNSSQEGMVIREGLKRIDQQEKDLRQSMVGASEPAQRALTRQISGLNTERESLLAQGRAFAASLSRDTDIDSTLNSENFTVAPTGSAAPLPPASAQTVAGSAGNGPEFPTGEVNISDLSPSLFFTDGDGAPLEPAGASVTPVTQAAAPAEMPTRRAEPVLPEAPLPNPPLDMFARDQYSEPVYPLRPPFLSDEQKQAAQERNDDEILRRELDWKNTPSPVKQQVVTNYIAQDPIIRSKEENLLELKNEAKLKEEILKTTRSKSAGALPEDVNAALSSYAEADLAYLKENRNVDVAKGQLTLELLRSKDPSSLIENRIQDRVESGVRKSQMEAAQLAKKREIELAAARRTGAGAGAAKSFGADTLEGRIAQESQKPLNIAKETNQQWTDAKSQITDAAGGQAKLNQVVFDVLQNPSAISSVLTQGANRDVVVMQIKEQISKLIPADVMRNNFPAKTLGFGPNAFEQKAERDGFQGVSWDNVITALADEMLTKYEAAYSNVMNPKPPSAKATPSTFKPTTGSSFTSIPE